MSDLEFKAVLAYGLETGTLVAHCEKCLSKLSAKEATGAGCCKCGGPARFYTPEDATARCAN